MADSISRTDQNDAPVSSGRHADPNALFDLPPSEAGKGYELVGRSVTVARPREELYEFWREFSNLGSFLHNVRSIQSADPVRAHWTMDADGEQSVSWDSIVVEDIPNEVIAWRAEAGSQLTHEGRVEFRDAPGARGTVVTATILYDPPGGRVGKLFAQVLHHDAKTQTRRELRRFKQLMETGEIATATPPHAAPRA
jgi:uncharacterized membrane protein